SKSTRAPWTSAPSAATCPAARAPTLPRRPPRREPRHRRPTPRRHRGLATRRTPSCRTARSTSAAGSSAATVFARASGLICTEIQTPSRPAGVAQLRTSRGRALHGAFAKLGDALLANASTRAAYVRVRIHTNQLHPRIVDDQFPRVRIPAAGGLLRIRALRLVLDRGPRRAEVR